MRASASADVRTLASSRDLALDLARDLDRELELVGMDAGAVARDVDLTRERARALVTDRVYTLGDDRTHALARVRAFDRDLVRDLDRALALGPINNGNRKDENVSEGASEVMGEGAGVSVGPVKVITPGRYPRTHHPFGEADCLEPGAAAALRCVAPSSPAPRNEIQGDLRLDDRSAAFCVLDTRLTR